MKNLPLLLIGGGVLFLLISSKKGSLLPTSIETPLKGISLLTCSSIKISNKKEFDSSLKEITSQVIKSTPTEKNHKVRILDIFEIVAPICYEKFNANSTENERMTFALLVSEIIKNYQSVLFPEIKEEAQIWEKVKIESLKSVFFKELNISQTKFDQINNQFQKVLQFPIPKPKV